MRWVCSYNGCRPQMITCFWYNQVPLVYLNYFYLGGISNSLRGNDRLNYHTSRRERSIKVLIVNVRDYLIIVVVNVPSVQMIFFFAFLKYQMICSNAVTAGLFSTRRLITHFTFQWVTSYVTGHIFQDLQSHCPMNQAIYSVIIDLSS